VFTPSICTSDVVSYWFDLDLHSHHRSHRKPNRTAKWPDPSNTDGEEAEAWNAPLVSEDGAPDVEPDALSRASLHHGGRLLPSASAAGDEREIVQIRLGKTNETGLYVAADGEKSGLDWLADSNERS